MKHHVPGYSTETVIGAAGVVGDVIDHTRDYASARIQRFAGSLLHFIDEALDAANFPPQPTPNQDIPAQAEVPIK